jgi:hypothetical protein
VTKLVLATDVVTKLVLATDVILVFPLLEVKFENLLRQGVSLTPTGLNILPQVTKKQHGRHQDQMI